MSQDMLSVKQFPPPPVEIIDPDSIGNLHSRDYPGRIKDIHFQPGSDKWHKAEAVKQRAIEEGGISKPVDLEYRSGHPFLKDGHHRYIAARDLGMPLPARRWK